MPPRRNNRQKGLTRAKRLLIGVLAAGFVLPAAAQTLNERIAQRASADKSRLLVDAREVVYDRDKDRVSAVGDVQLYYQGRVLEADRVTYDRKTKRVFAIGNAKLTEADGTKTYADRFDLTDDFRDGFIDSLRVETAEKTRLAAARGERSGGERTVLERGTFTACEACKEHPERPPLWQVKAARIIHNNAEQRIYYENASLEFFGVPVAWLPFFSAPDPSVRRLTGFLPPRITNKSELGFGVGIPIFWAIAPNYDVTFTPTYFAKQGFFGDLLWRHRLDNGSYSFRINGISQNEPTAFPIQPFNGAGQRRLRGSIETAGKFYLNEKWTFGWNGTWSTDKHYFTDYKTKPEARSTLFLSETISQVYLRGRGERSWFDLTGFGFQGLNIIDWQRQIETVYPSFDFDRRFTPDFLGGEVKLGLNGAVITRDAAVYQGIPVPGQTTTPVGFLYSTSAGGLYQPCRYALNGTIVGGYSPGTCLLRGFAGDYARGSVDLTWRRKFIDPLGQEWTPFGGLRADLAWLRVNLTGFNAPDAASQGYVGAGYGNQNQSNFFGGNADNFLFRGIPTIGVEYRYPFFAPTRFGTHHVEPIVQVVARSNETQIGNLPNEDAQSLIFDENSIFSINKFSGYDRVEGGTRVNYGARYSFNGTNNVFGSLLVGQSYQLAGRNSFAAADLANTGRNSGLQTRLSDYVVAATLQPNSATSITARGRFDERNFGLQRLDVDATATIGALNFRGTYSRIAPQPELGNALRREGVFLQSTLKLPHNFYVTGSTLFDLDRYLSDQALAVQTGSTFNNSVFRLASASVGFGYSDECTTLSLTYSRTIDDALASRGLANRLVSTYLVRLELRELGQLQLSQQEQR